MNGNLNESALASRLLAAQAIAREAGQLATRLRADLDKLDVRRKGPQDFVTVADGAAEKLIAERLRGAFPRDGFLGQETFEGKTANDAGALWIVDPIDGTSNFIAGRPDWCVSIGFLNGNRPEIGVIYQPAVDALFWARRGKGTFKKGIEVHVSACPSLAEATVGIDYSMGTPASDQAGKVKAMLETGGEYRRNGSAAVSLTQVAEGRLDGFVEMHLSSWDVHAGMVLITEAGGWTSDFFKGAGLYDGNPFIATTPRIRDDLLRLFRLEGWQ
jgi:myo-inositol-1(or 4)-monophosphatase